MPEGHTLHRLAAEYNDHFRGAATQSSSPQGRFAIEATVVDGRMLNNAEAYGKHLLVEFGAHTVHVHLGLAGRVGFHRGDPPPVVGAIRWRLTGADSPAAGEGAGMESNWTADLRGPAACELVTPGEIDALLARLGPDPLRPDADPDVGWQRICRSHVPIAALLMDQRVAAGVGNIYRAELLYRDRVDPMMQGRLLKHREWQRMWDDLVVLMTTGVRTGRIDTVRPEHEPEAMGREPRADRHGGEVYVYRRAGQACLVCGTRVRIAELAGRNLFWCPGCQRRTRRTAR
ncbi:MAG: Fpg/Nei family DNA glycosylase [Actinomycetota bacterium]|nr:Fpg/Nei family DNA glycosylase [Actinomycetota bacterium]